MPQEKSGRPDPKKVAENFERIMKIGDVGESENKVRLEQYLSGLGSNLESVTGNDWSKF